jgi:hypothetical protein
VRPDGLRLQTVRRSTHGSCLLVGCCQLQELRQVLESFSTRRTMCAQVASTWDERVQVLGRVLVMPTDGRLMAMVDRQLDGELDGDLLRLSPVAGAEALAAGEWLPIALADVRGKGRSSEQASAAGPVTRAWCGWSRPSRR